MNSNQIITPSSGDVKMVTLRQAVEIQDNCDDVSGDSCADCPLNVKPAHSNLTACHYLFSAQDALKRAAREANHDNH